jgi:hypothetical protein
LTRHGERHLICKLLDYRDFKAPEADENGYHIFTLWDLMSVFGEIMTQAHAFIPPIETEIEILTNNEN